MQGFRCSSSIVSSIRERDTAATKYQKLTINLFPYPKKPIIFSLIGRTTKMKLCSTATSKKTCLCSNGERLGRNIRTGNSKLDWR